MFNGKTEEDIEKVTQLFAQRIFTINNVVLIQVMLLMIFAIVLWVIKKEIVKKIHLMYGAFFLIGVYIVYQVGNYMMYLVSMETIEAVILAGYDRYVSTLGFFVFGVISIYFLEILNLVEAENKIFKRYGTIIMILMILGIFYGKSMYVRSMFVKDYVPQSEALYTRFILDDMVEQYHLENGKRSILYVGKNENDDLRYYGLVAKYILYSNDITIIDKKDVNKLNAVDDYDYAIILSHDETIDKWMAGTSLQFENGEFLNTENCYN